LCNRFLERSIEILRCVACLDSRNSFANFKVEKLLKLAKIYADDFSDYYFLYLLMILEMIEISQLVLILKMLMKIWFKLIYIHISIWYIVFELALILLVATTAVERAFSPMNIIRNE
jgi:hypothetical protein